MILASRAFSAVFVLRMLFHSNLFYLLVFQPHFCKKSFHFSFRKTIYSIAGIVRNLRKTQKYLISKFVSHAFGKIKQLQRQLKILQSDQCKKATKYALTSI